MGGVAGAPFGTGVGDHVYTLAALTEVAEDNITGAATSIIYGVEIDCTANTAEDVYVRFYNHADPTVGTTDADMVLKGYKGVTTTYVFEEGTIVWDTALSVACVTEAGGGSGDTGPSGTVDVTIVASE